MPFEEELISRERLNALLKAKSRASDLHRDLIASKVIAPEVIERFKELILLLNRAAESEPRTVADFTDTEFEKIRGEEKTEERR